ncbi:MAG: hypothetical protein EA424_29125 [Planctomycetaceae bacterium]|nr:MAG: hypothetical protein EA424_29125 [Planctomycetaceae bacterium]
MKTISRTMLWLAVVGLLVPHVGQVSAADRTVAAPTPQAQLVDIALTSNNLLQGQLVDRQGAPKAGTKVQLSSGTEVLAEGISDPQGAFRIPVERGGVYTLSDGEASALVRVWTQEAAPPSAQPAVLMVSDPELTRGALGRGGMDTVIGWAAIIGVTAAVIWAIADRGSSSPN